MDKTTVVDEIERLLLRLLDEEYTRHPIYGSRKMVVWLCAQGHCVNRKRVQRLMRILGLVAMVPGPTTSKKHPQNKVYPYLLRGLDVIRPDQAWSTDITYIRLAQGFVYLVTIIDWYSRKILAWQVSNQDNLFLHSPFLAFSAIPKPYPLNPFSGKKPFKP